MHEQAHTFFVSIWLHAMIVSPEAATRLGWTMLTLRGLYPITWALEGDHPTIRGPGSICVFCVAMPMIAISIYLLAMSAAAPAPADGVLNLKVSSPDNDDIYFKLKLTTKLVKVYAAVADKKGLPGPMLDGRSNESLSFRLLFDGQRLNMTLTPADYEMEDHDVINYFVEATGGGHV